MDSPRPTPRMDSPRPLEAHRLAAPDDLVALEVRLAALARPAALEARLAALACPVADEDRFERPDPLQFHALPWIRFRTAALGHLQGRPNAVLAPGMAFFLPDHTLRVVAAAQGPPPTLVVAIELRGVDI